MSDHESDEVPALEEVDSAETEPNEIEVAAEVDEEPQEEEPTEIDVRIRVERPKLEHVLSGKPPILCCRFQHCLHLPVSYRWC